MLLYQILLYTIHEKIKKSYKNNKFKISALTWNKEFELPDESYSVSEKQYFEYIIKKHETFINNSPIKIYLNKIESRITSKIKTGYYSELLMHETMELLGSTNSKTTKIKNDENMPHLEITEVVLAHCNVANND